MYVSGELITHSVPSVASCSIKHPHRASRGIVAQFLDHGIIACEDRPDLGYFVVIQIQKFRYPLPEGLRIAG